MPGQRHLGKGASMHAGKTVATTMGFTAVDGLPMGTRAGSLDPGVLLYLIGEHAAPIRDWVCRDASWLELALDCRRAPRNLRRRA